MSKVLQTIGLTALELARIAPLSEAAELSGLSEDTLRRRFADKIISLSPKRRGMRVRDALLLSDTTDHNG
jgi:hypothetical protein